MAPWVSIRAREVKGTFPRAEEAGSVGVCLMARRVSNAKGESLGGKRRVGSWVTKGGKLSVTDSDE